eukprot:6202072-Pleurochrysis_carterae.AAC.3
MAAAQVVGVLVGTHEPNLRGLEVHYAHYVDTEILDAKDAASYAAQQIRRRSAAQVLSGKPDRKGYHTFRCGGIVQSRKSETLGMVATVSGVVGPQVRSQLRRLLVLAEMAGETCAKSNFFVSSWTSCTRMPPADQPEPADFHPDDVETDVQAAGAEKILPMIKAK